MENEKAVSPVIGVIFMVAITVILAAVIAAFIFGMAGDMRANKNVVVLSKQILPDKIQLTNYGGRDLHGLQLINITGDLKTLPASLPLTTGATQDYELSVGAGPKHIVIVGIWSDGTEQVLLIVEAQRTV